jgi:hypothetical protein
VAILERLARNNTQKLCMVAGLCGAQSDALFRQIEIKKINTHDRPLKHFQQKCEAVLRGNQFTGLISDPASMRWTMR